MTKQDAMAPSLAVVMPVYEDSDAFRLLVRDLHRVMGGKVQVVAVDDGSVRRPLTGQDISWGGLAGVVVTLRRNVGHQRALAVGLGYIAELMPEADRVVIMDSDGEDRPDSIPELLKALENGEVDVVVARRRRRHESLLFRLFYVIYRRLFQVLTGRRLGFGNFMALTGLAVRRLASNFETGIHVAGSVLTSRLRIASLDIDRGSRYAGTSKMNFVGLALHGFKGLMVFAEDVLVRVGIACAITASLSVAAAGLAVILKLIGYATPGWFSVALGILVLMFLQTGILALMSLLLTGVVKGGLVPNINYREYIEKIESTEGRDRITV